jgi:hypothetical protein
MKRAGAALLGLCVLAGCRWGTLSPQEFEADYGSLSAVPLVGASYFAKENAEALPAEIERALGGNVRALSIVVYPNNVTLEAFDPRRPDELNMYFFRDGALWSTQPRTVAEDSEQKAFDLREAPFSRLPELVTQARAEFKKLRGITAYATVQRAWGGARDLRVSVHCNAPRGSGWLEFDARGRMLGKH